MRGYRRAWQTWWLSFALAGTAIAVLLWPGAVVLMSWLVGGTLGLAAVTAVRPGDDEVPASDRVSARQTVTDALVGAVVASGVFGWLDISGAGGMGLVALAALSSPPCVERLGLLADAGTGTGATSVRAFDLAAADEAALARASRMMSTAQLCAVWHQTFTDVDRPDEPGQQLTAVRMREVVLDELARRDPAGLDAWMCSTVPVESAPTPFFGADPPDVSS